VTFLLGDVQQWKFQLPGIRDVVFTSGLVEGFVLLVGLNVCLKLSVVKQ